ncbi:MAG: glycogen synthase GlgA [Elusimicrobia bacterium]|nr:glycogen synthase GlgA [Elusimicrobiota bacterium]MDE2236968.1 glycogen synthase GlgA [Elusimicrobiota bacterium]MDE2426196.1 glycogen synthase GlgA [Elusimicrobiota bacterium]
MKIVLAASEAVPFCKTGGLADVVGAMAQKLGAAGHDVLLALPKYRSVESAVLQGGAAQALPVPLGTRTLEVGLRYMQRRSVSVCLLDYPPFFDREGLYGHDGSDYPDNDRRFILFQRGALEAVKRLGFKPDILHVHDWQTGLMPLLLKRHYAQEPLFSRTASVMTVHNMAYQGLFAPDCLEAAGLPWEDFSPEGLEYYGKVSFLKAGLAFADRLTTVSPNYAREIQSSGERGFGMEGLLRRRSASLSGVLNGIDLDVWNPRRDPALPRRYGVGERATGKADCKASLQREAGLPARPGSPLVGVVSRLDYQKGLDIAIRALEPRLGRCQLAVVGTGDMALQQELWGLARRHPGLVHFHRGFDDAFAHRLYAACDIFLMPSRFEPCGLGQMIAMRYGAVPVASRTGGLADTVFERPAREANGFICEPADEASLGSALDRALEAFGTPAWDALADAGMSRDFSWEGSIKRYLELYESARRERVKEP